MPLPPAVTEESPDPPPEDPEPEEPDPEELPLPPLLPPEEPVSPGGLPPEEPPLFPTPPPEEPVPLPGDAEEPVGVGAAASDLCVGVGLAPPMSGERSGPRMGMDGMGKGRVISEGSRSSRRLISARALRS